MAGMISGTMFTSISSFLQVIMDPNEYDLLQGRLFAKVLAMSIVSIYYWLLELF